MKFKYSNDSNVFKRSSYQNLQYPQECSICNKTDWCQTLVNDTTGAGEADVCKRPESWARSPEIEINDGSGVFLRNSEPISRPKEFKYQIQTKSKREKASSKKADQIYRQMLKGLGLQDEHKLNLVERELTEDEIKILGYRSLPTTHEQRTELMQSLSRFEGDLLKVGGFDLTNKNRIWITQQQGMLIPCRNVEGQIVGGQIRSDDNQSSRYRWFSASSSDRKRGGVSSGAPIHVAKWEGDNSTVWITEGILKADIASLKLGQTVIGVAGIRSYDHEELRQTLQALGAKEVIIAFDADYVSNPSVKEAINQLARLVSSFELNCQQARWDIDEGKGIDDLLANGRGYSLFPMSANLDIRKVRSTPQKIVVDGQEEWQKQKRVRIEPVKIEIIKPNATTAEVRRAIPQQINRFFDGFESGGTLMLRVSQGVGKSTSSLKTLIQETDRRIVLASPRHQLLKEAIAEHGLQEWTHIRPRRPQEAEAQLLSVEASYKYLQIMKQNYSLR